MTAKIQSLLDQNAQLTSKITTQEQTVKALQDELKAIKTGTAAGSSGNTGNAGNTGNTGNSGTAGNTGGNTATPPATIGKATVNVDALNVRAQANTTSKIVAKTVKGETVTLVSKSGDWYKITTSKGVAGFVMAKYVTVKK